MPICPKCDAPYENDGMLCPKCTVAARAETERREKRLNKIESLLWIVLCFPGISALMRRFSNSPPSPYPTAYAIFLISLIVVGIGGLIGLAIYRRQMKKRAE